LGAGGRGMPWEGGRAAKRSRAGSTGFGMGVSVKIGCMDGRSGRAPPDPEPGPEPAPNPGGSVGGRRIPGLPRPAGPGSKPADPPNTGRLMSLNDRRGTEATLLSLIARSVQDDTKVAAKAHPTNKMVFVGGAFAPNPVFDDARIATKDAPIPPCLPHRSRSALVGPSVHAEPRQAADRYPNLRSLEGKSQPESPAPAHRWSLTKIRRLSNIKVPSSRADCGGYGPT
jgi:hypothetical protein